jgi:hypothetical protein
VEAYHGEARRSGPHPTSISGKSALPDRGRGCEEQSELLEEERICEVKVSLEERLSYLASGTWRNAMPHRSGARSLLRAPVIL